MGALPETQPVDVRMNAEIEHWDLVLKPSRKWHDVRIAEIFRYRDLLFLFVRRDFVALYKQTILGPLWFFIQPIITSLTFTVIFGNLAGIPTDGVPPLLFYLCGVTLWNYFSDTLTKTADTFTMNAAIFGKVYFPRMIVPLSVVLSNLIKFSVQFSLFLVVWLYHFTGSNKIAPNAAILLLPVLVLIMGFLGLSLGIIISSLTTKYRDLKFLVSFGVQMLMYLSPIVYPLSLVPDKYRAFILANPVTGVIETFKFAFLGVGKLEIGLLVYSMIFTVASLIVGLLVFNKVEQSFNDTI